MDTRTAIAFLRNYGIQLSDAGLRAAVKRGKIGNVEKRKGNYHFSRRGLTDYLLRQDQLNKYDSYQLGYQNAVNEIQSHVIQEKGSYMFAGASSQEFYYLCPNLQLGFNVYLVRNDFKNKKIHLYPLKNDDYATGSMIFHNIIVQDIVDKLYDHIAESGHIKITLLIYSKNQSSKEYTVTPYDYYQERTSQI